MTSEPKVPVTEEADIFEALGLTYRPPEQRESLGTNKKTEGNGDPKRGS